MKREGDYIKHPPPTLYVVESFSFINIHLVCLSLSLSHIHTHAQSYLVRCTESSTTILYNIWVWDGIPKPKGGEFNLNNTRPPPLSTPLNVGYGKGSHHPQMAMVRANSSLKIITWTVARVSEGSTIWSLIVGHCFPLRGVSLHDPIGHCIATLKWLSMWHTVCLQIISLGSKVPRDYPLPFSHSHFYSTIILKLPPSDL